MLLILANIIGKRIEQGHQFLVLPLRARHSQYTDQRLPGLLYAFDLKSGHNSFFPRPTIVLCVRQDVADVNLVSIVMHGRDQSSLVPAEVKNRKLSHRIRMRKRRAQLGQIREAARAHDPVPVRQR
jgi:hypothetical protein